MKTESLHALLMDRELGELTPEAAELLAAWLAEHPAAAREVETVQRTVAIAGTALRRFPDLARVAPEAVEPPRAANVLLLPTAPARWRPLALAASVALLLGGAGWMGFRAGVQSAPKLAVDSRVAPPATATAAVARPRGPWTRYAFASDPRGGLTVVRRDPQSQP
jgi:anti-sigma factor RsiW